jgi:hypothetical protein
LKRRSLPAVWVAPVLFFAFSFLLVSCGNNFFFAGRNLPPSGLTNRVLIAEQNPSPLAKGALPFVDAFYDIRHAFNSSTGPSFSISGFSGALPVTIQNMPEEQTGGVYSAGDGSFTLINYGQEKVTGPVTIPGGFSTGVFITQDEKFLYAANPASHVISIEDVVNKISIVLNLPNVYHIAVNPGGTVVLAFVQSSIQTPGTSSCITSTGYSPQNPSGPQPACAAPQGQFSAYSIVHLTSAQSTAAANNPNYLGAQDCEPQNLPQYCAFPVSTGANASFDNPVKAVFSPDGSTIYVLNCGPECGGKTAGITTIPITAASLNNSSEGASGINLVAQSNLAIPGGATNAAFNGNTLYVAGQQLQPDGLFAGNLSVVNTGVTPLQLTGTFSISDGTHNKMVFADNSTLWIGSVQCQLGERYKQVQAGANVPYGCMTMFNTSNNAVLLESYKGDGTGVAAVTGLNKVYTAEGGQVYIYNTTDGSARDNTNVTVTGTAADVAYMDAASDADNTTY